MACGHSERTRAPESNRASDSSRIAAAGPRAAAVPSPHSARPQQSWVPGLVTPATVIAKAVAEPAVGCLRLREEVQVAPRQHDELMARRRLPAHHHQAAGNVIDTVTMLMPRHGALGVLQQADVIGEPEQVPERRIRAVHATAPSWERATVAARSR